MRWPPNKAWTSVIKRKGFRHFEVKHFGGRGEARWVELFPVLKKDRCFRVLWSELKIHTEWTSGWLQLEREESIPSNEDLIVNKQNNNHNQTCLHPSSDSGIIIPSEISNPRPWFMNE